MAFISCQWGWIFEAWLLTRPPLVAMLPQFAVRFNRVLLSWQHANKVARSLMFRANLGWTVNSEMLT